MASAPPRTLFRFMRPFTTNVVNRFTRLFVHRLPGFGVISYRGRKTGRRYRTPMNVFRDGGDFVFALTYGSDVDWVRNVLAAGEADLRIGSRSIHLTDPELFVDPARSLMPLPVRIFLGLTRVTEFLRMRASNAQPRNSSRRSSRVPKWVPIFSAIARPLLSAGVPMGPNRLITIRGRRTGLPRSTPITIIEHAGRRGLISPFGETDWVRNLRIARRAIISRGRQRELVTADELAPLDAADFIREVLAPHARRTRLGSWIVRNLDRIDYDNPAEAARGRPVFEIHPA